MSHAVLYGLGIETDFEMHQTGGDRSPLPDVCVHTGPVIEDWDPQPDGETLLDLVLQEPWYTVVRRSDGAIHFRIHAVCDYLIQPNLCDVELRLHTSAPKGMDAVMTTGALLSLLLYLRGTPVFHGSAVEVDGQAIAFIGHSGQGKTTMATLFCTEGAAAVTDDVLVVDDADKLPRVRRGSGELRLRSGAAELAASLKGARRRLSADERNVVAPRYSSVFQPPLRAILVPMPTRDGSALRFERLRQMDATLALLNFPRLMGWNDPTVVKTIFREASALAQNIPVIAARIPWGPPFPPAVTEALFQELDS